MNLSKLEEVIQDLKNPSAPVFETRGGVLFPASSEKRHFLIAKALEAERVILSDAYLKQSASTKNGFFRKRNLANESPFSTFTVEFEGTRAVRYSSGGNLYSFGLAIEINPGNFGVLAYYEHSVLGWLLVYNEPCNQHALFSQAVDALNEGHYGSIKSRKKLSIKIEGKKTFKKTKNITYIYPYKKGQSEITTPSGYRVSFSHRFLVRGHWRAVPGKIGKNRTGEYIVNDFTWVTEHERGDESSPLLKKHKIVMPAKDVNS